LENEPEGGKRCDQCFKFRLEKTFKKAAELKMNLTATTLSLSPHKNAESINEIGTSLSTRSMIFYEADFKKNAGYQRSIEISKKYHLYRQNYCGCLYSTKHEAES
jgi:predicted adenine nucleotide alpha hydrolase (AANH) superfamily ATPase